MTDIDKRRSQGSKLKFNTPASFVQGIKDMFSVRRVDPEGWVATDFWWHAWNRHMFIFFCFVQGKTQPGPSSMKLRPCFCNQNHGGWHHRVQKFARQPCVTSVGNVTVMV